MSRAREALVTTPECLCAADTGKKGEYGGHRNWRSS
jgi:hypothetical protein